MSRVDDGFKRDNRGRFGKGNRGGPGNPLAGLVEELRAKALKRMKKRGSVTRAIDALDAALDGGKTLTPSQVIALREVLDRAGISAASMLDERRVEADERAVESLTELEEKLANE